MPLWIRYCRTGWLLWVKAGYILAHPGLYRFLRTRHADALAIKTDLTLDEKLLLTELGRRVPAGGCVVEIGSYLGASTSLLAASVQSGGGHVYAVDTWQNDAMPEAQRDTFAEFTANTRRYADAITPLRGRSAEVAREFERGIDLLFVDGDHSYEGCHADMVGWLPHMNDGGTVVFHDHSWADGVRRSVAEDLSGHVRGRIHLLPNIGHATVRMSHGR